VDEMIEYTPLSASMCVRPMSENRHLKERKKEKIWVN
jgi:hypothetical protein